MKSKTVIAAFAVALLVVAGAFAAPRLVIGAALVPPQLMHNDVIGMPGKEVRVMIVSSPPGASSPVHRHNAQVFVNMISGRMTMQAR